MAVIPKILRKTPTVKKLLRYMEEEFTEVLHTTLNPEGPGNIRIHLIPPRTEEGALNSSVVIINGTDIVPVNFLWTVMVAELIKAVNVYDGQAVSEAEIAAALDQAAEKVHGIYPFMKKSAQRKDLEEIYRTFWQIACREPVTTEIRHLNIGEYADYMKAPHRMDVMVSAMAKEGKWHCNQKCVHCYAAGQVHAEEKELTTEEWKRVLDKCREAGIPQITFTGGEPTMRDDLIELIAYSRWFISRLNTNGIRLTEEYCRKLRAAELDSVQITFYSADAAVHNVLVGAPRYEDTVRGIENALKTGLSVSINTPLCTLNQDYLSTLKFLHEKGIIYVTCSGLITTGNAEGEASKRLQLTTEEIEKILTEAITYCNENGMEIAFTSPGWVDAEFLDKLNASSPACGACLSNMAVTPAGNVVPCQSWLSDDVLGNMLKDDWADIWNSETCASCRNYAAEMTGRCPLRRYC